MRTLTSSLIALLRAASLSRTSLALKNAALRQQLTIYQRNQKHPRFRLGDRVFWVVLRRLWSAWRRSLIIVQPETVIALASPRLQAVLASLVDVSQSRSSPDSPPAHRYNVGCSFTDSRA